MPEAGANWRGEPREVWVIEKEERWLFWAIVPDCGEGAARDAMWR